MGVTVVDQLWLGVEVKAHRFDVNAPGGPVSSYHTYSVGPVVGYKLFLVKGLYLNAYGRFWPTVATSLHDNKVALAGANGTVIHTAHDWGTVTRPTVYLPTHDPESAIRLASRRLVENPEPRGIVQSDTTRSVAGLSRGQAAPS